MTSVADEVHAARRAITSGDHEHAARHVGRALQEKPDDVGALAAAESLFAAADDPLGLVPLGERVSVGTALLRATFLERLARPAEAIPLLAQVLAVLPSRALAARIDACSARPGALLELDLDAFAEAALVALRTEGMDRALLPVLRRLRNDRGSSELLGFVASKAERSCGNAAAGLEISRAQAAATPSYRSFVSLGSALREAGHAAEAVDAFRRALDYDPDNLPVRRDIGDSLLELDRPAEAAAVYAEVLQRAPDDPWALPSHLFAAIQAGSAAPDARTHLRALARADSEDGRAHALYHRLDPWRVTLRPPDASLVNVAGQVWQSGATMVTTAVSSMEAPSAVLAFGLSCGRSAERASDGVTFGEVPDPDPRLPARPVRFQVWTYREGGLLGRLAGRLRPHARSAVDPPPPAVARAVASLAATDYDIDVWAPKAARMAQAQEVEPLLAVMVHMPVRPEVFPPWSWVFRVQVAAALALAGQAAESGPASPAWEALTSLLFGPLDWTTSAAVIALCDLGARVPAREREVVAALKDVLHDSRSPIEHQNLTGPLVHCTGWLPGAAIRT